MEVTGLEINTLAKNIARNSLSVLAKDLAKYGRLDLIRKYPHLSNYSIIA